MSEQRTIFLKPKFKGERFEQHSIPVTVLRELEVYQEFILALAKELYKQKTGKKRVPRLFAERCRLHLKQIDNGSAVSVLERVNFSDNTQISLLGEEGDFFEEARDLVIRCIEAVSLKKDLPSKFPKKLTKYFSSFGQSLRDDESIEICLPTEEQGPLYNQETRKNISRSFLTEYAKETEHLGYVCEMDIRQRTFQIKTEKGDVLEYPLFKETESMIYSLMGGRERRTVQLRITSIAVFDGNRGFKKIDKIKEITAEEREDLVNLVDKVEGFSQLEAGWFDGEGLGFHQEGLQQIADWLLEMVVDYNLPLPFVYPTPDGGVQAEWSLDGWEISVKFHWQEQRAYLFADNSKEDLTKEGEFEFSSLNFMEDVSLQILAILKNKGFTWTEN